MAKHLFSSESVTKGHPDKICDRISDSILDAIMAQDPNGRVACETCCTTGMVLIMGEISTTANIDIPSIARKAICDIGYDSADKGFDGNTCAIITSLDKQSPDIAMGVDASFELKGGEEDKYNLNGAGDQGMMFGYACDETPELMPMPISLAHKLALKLTEERENGELAYLRADGKTQVTVEYDDDRVVRIDAIVVSSQHSADVALETIRKDIIEKVVKQIEKKIDVLQAHYFTDDEIFLHEIALYKVSIPEFQSNPIASKVIRRYNARIVEVNPVFAIVEKAGMTEEITSLYEELQALGCVLQFVRSGRVAITTSCFERVNEYLTQREEKYRQQKERKEL